MPQSVVPAPHVIPTLIYTVREQWPHREIASFRTLADAQDYVRTHGHNLALPIITSREV